MEEKRMIFEEFAPMFGMWADMFRPFIESEPFYDIYQKLKEDAFEERNGKLYRKEFIAPDSDDVFRVFATTDPNRIKTIWYLMDPYPRRYKPVYPEKIGKFQATGIAMDCRNSPDGKLQPSLEKFYDAMEKDLKKKVQRTPDLSYLCQQGVMLVNTDLTCKLNKTNSHAGYWDKFQKFFLEEILRSKIDIQYVLCGKESEKMERYINPFAKIIKLEHPAFAERMHRDWDAKNIFTTINKNLAKSGQEQIIWDYGEWHNNLLDELPF